ncbi:M13 family metallopeptidase [bacterium]|nr:M13 family metallopeptidase [bacterium]
MSGKNTFNVNDLDTRTSPADDFFQYANGGWIDKNLIPSTQTVWGSFHILQDENIVRLRGIVEDIVHMKNVEGGSNEQKIRDLYSTAMDMEKRNRDGISPLDEEMSKINHLSTKQELFAHLAHMHRIGIGPLFTAFVDQDQKDSSVMAFHMHQGGLSLPDRDYYLKDDPKHREIREKFLAYGRDMLMLAGVPEKEARGEIGVVFGIEKGLAESSMTRTDLRDPYIQYNKMRKDEFYGSTPSIPWDDYFKPFLPHKEETLIINQPAFFKRVEELLAEIPLADFKIYLRWQLLDDMAGTLSDEFVNREFEFHGTFLSGQPEIKPLWKRSVILLSGALGEVLGQEYVKRYFPSEAKNKIDELIGNLMEAYRDRIAALSWMEKETKERALAKLAAIEKKIAYPDVWRDYSKLVIKPDTLAANCFRAAEFEFDYEIGKLGEPVDRTEWLMTPQTVNAYYHPTKNEIVFPAGILAPPFFDFEADAPLNYGAIGAVIGHELTHGFDDMGRHYDKDGNLRDWWSSKDKSRFEERAEKLAKQYDAFEPLPGVHINGRLTLGENIADLGGLVLAFHALQKYFERHGRPANIDGYTPEQRFFLGAAVAERGIVREETARQRLITDPHSPPRYRVNGPLSNMKEFYDAFGIKEGDALWRDPADRVEIW